MGGFQFESRLEAEKALVAWLRDLGDSVESGATRRGGRRSVIGADGEIVRRDFAGQVQDVRARQRLAGCGDRALAAVLEGFRAPSWEGVHQLTHDQFQASLCWHALSAELSEVALSIAVYAPTLNHPSPSAWRTCAPGPIPPQGLPHVERARELLPEVARRWYGWVGSLDGNRGLGVWPSWMAA